MIYMRNGKLLVSADGKLCSSCCPEYGDDCTHCSAGETPKYLDVIFSNIVTTLNSCCVITGIDSRKKVTIVPAAGTYRLEQDGGDPCIWKYARTGSTEVVENKYTDGTCSTFFAADTYDEFHIVVTRAVGTLTVDCYVALNGLSIWSCDESYDTVTDCATLAEDDIAQTTSVCPFWASGRVEVQEILYP